MWSGSSSGCPTYGLTLEADIPGFTGTAAIEATVEGQPVTGNGANPFVGGGNPAFLYHFPTLADGVHTVTVTATAPGFAVTTRTTQVTYTPCQY